MYLFSSICFFQLLDFKIFIAHIFKVNTEIKFDTFKMIMQLIIQRGISSGHPLDNMVLICNYNVFLFLKISKCQKAYINSFRIQNAYLEISDYIRNSQETLETVKKSQKQKLLVSQNNKQTKKKQLKTVGNSQELLETVGNSQELLGTVQKYQNLLGTVRNVKNHQEVRYCQELPLTINGRRQTAQLKMK